jgi:hypothetical protein
MSFLFVRCRPWNVYYYDVSLIFTFTALFSPDTICICFVDTCTSSLVASSSLCYYNGRLKRPATWAGFGKASLLYIDFCCPVTHSARLYGASRHMCLPLDLLYPSQAFPW